MFDTFTFDMQLLGAIRPLPDVAIPVARRCLLRTCLACHHAVFLPSLLGRSEICSEARKYSLRSLTTTGRAIADGANRKNQPAYQMFSLVAMLSGMLSDVP